MEHTWAKIKSWIQTYLGSWKTTNFGSGTYNNTGSIAVSSNLNVATNVHISGECEIIIDTPLFEREGIVGPVEYIVTITKRHGILYILPSSDTDYSSSFRCELYAKNESGEKIQVVVLDSELDSGTGGNTGVAASYTIKPKLYVIENEAQERICRGTSESMANNRLSGLGFIASCYW